MASNTVNLDALIPRADFALNAASSGGNPRSNIALTDLNDGFFSTALRKPDFQRETTHWTPAKIVDLVEAFVKRDLIPAVILWQRGSEIFVIDGAHRLSALIAWVRDDYGDGKHSTEFFGAQLSEEQRKIADKTRALMRKRVGTYAEFEGMKQARENLPPDKQALLTALGSNSVVVQWVTATEPKAAEDSFFKINQAAQPIDPTERMILQSRESANAIAARAIVHGGRGHKYWAEFPKETQTEIEACASRIHSALYTPALQEPIKTTDMPVAGKGYNALPFAFFLVNLANKLPIPKTSTDKGVAKPEGRDVDGKATLAYLRAVERDVRLVTTNDPGSLGLHPGVYFYANSGAFLPVAYLGATVFANALAEAGKLKDFCRVRAAVEQYIFENRTFVSLTITRLGSGSRSLGRVKELFWRVYQGFSDGKSSEEITKGFLSDNAFAHFAVSKVPSPRQAEGPSSKGQIAKTTKSAAFLKAAMPGVAKCVVCGAALHANSISYEHNRKRRDGGSGTSDNVSISHPFCNSGVSC